MEQKVEQVFSKEILYNAASNFALVIEEKPIGDFENYLFKGHTEDGMPRVLRLTHSSHRNKKEIESELSFLNYIRENDANAAGSLASLNGNLVEEHIASDGSRFFASMFEWADGKLPDSTNPQVWNDDLMFEWGKTIGKLHALTVNYPVTDHRVTWDEDPYVVEALQNKVIGTYTKELLDEMGKYPRNKDSYGLIHSDVHQHNFFVNEAGKITVFDFDDLQYNYFIHDLAIVIYYTAWGSKGTFEEKSSFAKHQLSVLRKGYETEYVLEEKWYETIPAFLKLRDQTLYHVLSMKYDGKEKSERLIKLVEEIENRIINNKAIVNI